MENNIAVLIDFENIAAGVDKEGLGRLEVGLIMTRFREKGRVLVARSYADWGRFSRFKKDLLFEGVVLFELSAHGMNDKNRADVALVVDCLELAFTKPHLDTFVIVSGDSDFTPLILKLRELNKRIIGCGTRRSTSRLIVEACDEFVFYDTLRSQRTQRSRRGKDDSDNTITREEAMELVTASLDSLQREDPKPVHASILKEHILRKEPAFNEVDLGFSSLTRFMDFCQRQGVVKLSKDPKGGGYLVDAPDSEEAQAPVRPVTDLSPGAQRLYDQLAGEEMEPVTRELRGVLARHIVESVEERTRRDKRINLNWVIQDLLRRLKGDPRINSRRVKGTVNALHRGGVFLHGDGDPVRSFFASFEIRKDAEGLVRTLDEVYTRRLLELNGDLAQAEQDLAELLYGDRALVRPVQEMLAWQSMDRDRAALSEVEDEIPPEVDDASPMAERAAAQSEPEEGASKRRRRRRNRRGESGDAEAPGPEAAPEQAVEQAVEPVVEPEAEQAVEPEAEPVVEPVVEPEAAPEKPATTTRRRRPRKPKADAAS